ncbi:hypothetical protein ACWDYH_08830 [Nocardia goodfellowii]
MGDELYVDKAGVEGMIGVLNTSQEALNALQAQSFFHDIEAQLPGSGLANTFMKAGWRAQASAKGVAGQLKEINDAAAKSLQEYTAQQERQARITQILEGSEGELQKAQPK